MSGYTIDKSTLYKPISAFLPGNIYGLKITNIFLKNTMNGNHGKYMITNLTLKNNLLKLNEKIIKKLIKSVNNRQIVVPLSGAGTQGLLYLDLNILDIRM